MGGNRLFSYFTFSCCSGRLQQRAPNFFGSIHGWMVGMFVTAGHDVYTMMDVETVDCVDNRKESHFMVHLSLFFLLSDSDIGK